MMMRQSPERNENPMDAKKHLWEEREAPRDELLRSKKKHIRKEEKEYRGSREPTKLTTMKWPIDDTSNDN